MPRFFLETISGDSACIAGEDARHISRVLRMQPGRDLTVNDMRGMDYLCRITEIRAGLVSLKILESMPCQSESKIPIRLYQAIPKGDKLEFIVQKAVELGAAEIIPVLTSRCISRPSDKGMEKRLVRLRRIALEAAKQSGRGIIPRVRPVMPFADAVSEMASGGLAVMLYEESSAPLNRVLRPHPESVSLLVGSEGGFSKNEAAFAQERGVAAASLGKRILRCETAPVCALSALLYHLGEI